MTTEIRENTVTPDALDLSVKRGIRFIPLHLAVPVAIWLAFTAAGVETSLAGFGLGALGWIVALMLRGPVSVLAMKLPKESGQKLVVGSSGPLEEGVRLALLALTSFAFDWSASVGQGWAAIEVVYAIVQIAAVASLVKRTDEKAMQARAMLESQGHLSASPLWGVVERIFASFLHIGATLIVAAQPWTVVLLVIAHSAVNLSVISAAKKSILLTETIVAIVGTAALVTGLLLHQ